MNVAISEFRITDATSGNFHELERLLSIPLYDFNLWRLNPEVEAFCQRISEAGDRHEFGIVIPVSECRGTLKKIWSLLYTARKAREMKAKLTQATGDHFDCYGVYPDIINPVAVYQLASPAENYANRYFLPPIRKGLNGYLRRLIFSVIRFHPSTAGIILIKRNA